MQGSAADLLAALGGIDPEGVRTIRRGCPASGQPIPRQQVDPVFTRPQIEAAHRAAGCVENIDRHLVGRARQFEAHHVFEFGRADAVARHQHGASDQVGRLRHLVDAHACGERLQGGIHVLDALHRGKLGHLAGHLGVVERVQRILVLHLRDQQGQKAVFGFLDGAAGCCSRAGAEQAADTACVLYRTHGVSFLGFRFDCSGWHHWPRFRVLSSRVLVVFIISTLDWYEREAEIMLTISSTTLTLGMVT